jgi:adenine-specific DNA-methyltransferase
MIKDIETQNDSKSICDKEIAILREHFPSCFTKEGAFDIEIFKEVINEKVDVTKEGYELSFLGKDYAKLLVSLDTTTVITPNKEHNELPENKDSKNVYISGDNLDGLHHLLKSYSNEVKCIYIDPPYNTGSDGFVYNDKFSFKSEDLQRKLSVDEDEAQRILDLTNRGSASHSAWLLFMYPRLQLARELLTMDGVIFLSIDDNELANLKRLCDDVFGAENFVGQWNWFKSATPPNLSKKIKKNIEYVLCYQRRENVIKFQGIRKYSSSDDPITKPQNTIKDLVFPPKTLNFSGQDGEIKAGIYGTDKYPNELLNDLTISCGTNENEVTFRNKFTWTQPKLKDELEKETIMNLSKNLVISYKKADYGAEVPPNFINEKVGVTTTENAGRKLAELFNGLNVFDYPKPTSLIQYLTNFIINDDDIIVDFFGGSASTAETIMLDNASSETKNLKYILVQLPEDLNETYKNSSGPKKTKVKAVIDFLKSINRPTTLDYVGIERIIRASKKIKEETKADIDYGFKHYILNEPNQNTLDKCETFDKASLIPDGSILEDFGAETVLTTWLNYDGYGLNTNAEIIDLDGYTAYYYDKHLYLINPDFTKENVVALFEKYEAIGSFNPENVILFGYSFNEWSVTEMLEQNLKILNDTEKNLKININVRY